MAVVELRQKSLHFDLSPAECETPHLKAMLLEKLKQSYEHTCMDGSYVLQITRILGEPAPRVFNPRKMNGEMQTSVLFEYKAEILVSQSEVKMQSVLHGGNVIEITEHAGGVLASCAFGQHMTGTILVDLHGIVSLGMIIPVRVSDAEYTQSTLNNVSIMGELLRPTHHASRYILVSAGSDADMIAGQRQLAKLNGEIARITSEHKRAQFFKSWLFPYKTVPNRKTLTLASLLVKRQTKAMYVRIDDACDIANLEFMQVSKIPLVDTMPFAAFVTSMIEEARHMWKDIATFSETYADDAVFAEHKTMWAYYENAKFTDAPDASLTRPPDTPPATVAKKSTKRKDEPPTDASSDAAKEVDVEPTA
jgi:hypothetical protein